MKAYIATSLTNATEHNELRDLLAARGVGLTYDWTAHGSVWREGRERIAQVAEREASGVAAADLLIAILPGGRGTHVEIGIAIAFRIPVVVVPQSTADYEGPETCAFYHHSGVTIASTRSFHRIADSVRLAIEIAR